MPTGCHKPCLRFEPMYFSSGEYSKVENGIGACCPSKLPLQCTINIYSWQRRASKNYEHSHADRNLQSLGTCEGIGFHTPNICDPIKGGSVVATLDAVD